MKTSDILDNLRNGGCLHIRYESSRIGPKVASLSSHGRVDFSAAIRATDSPYVRECYDGDGKCYEWGQ